jgi:NhaP-type Na+/H+ or K+/H+ antiporter
VAGIVFNKLYFPVGDPFISMMLAYTTFAVGFLARPLGPNGGWAVAGYCVFAGIVSALSAVWISHLAKQRAGGSLRAKATA